MVINMDNDKVICTFCGEEYSPELSRCPECGEKNKAVAKKLDDEDAAFIPDTYDEEEDEEPVAGRRGGNPDKIPIWLKSLILVVAGLAIIVAALFMLYRLGMINFGRSGNEQVQTSVSLPVNEDVDPMADESPVVETTAPSAEPTPAISTLPETTEPVESQLPSAEPTPEIEDPVEETPTVECNSITINRTDITFFGRGEVCNFNVMTEPSSAAEYVEWSSSDPTIVRVDSLGSATAVNGGTAYVIATCGDQTVSCIVRCSFEAAEYMTMSSQDITMTTPGETATLTVQEVAASEASRLVWSSSDESVATVDSNGTVTAVSRGTVTVTADLDGVIAECVVRVNIPSLTTEDGTEVIITMNHTDVTLFTIGETVQLRVETTGSTAIDASSLTWASRDETVASVDSTGLVRATGAGNTTVYTTVGGENVSCIIRVNLQ